MKKYRRTQLHTDSVQVTLINAKPHVGSSTLLKLDIRHFFDRITYPLVKEKVFKGERFSEQNRILLSLLCIHNDSLPQGAPTSPIISNIIMRDFDNAVGKRCSSEKINYTRYSDDMTFSGDFEPGEVICFVRQELRKMGFFLNGKKTKIVHDGQKKSVTGIVVNKIPSVPSEYRRKLRQELYYCRRYGMEEHIFRTGLDISANTYAMQLLGRVNYVLQIMPNNSEMQQYKKWLKRLLSNTNKTVN